MSAISGIFYRNGVSVNKKEMKDMNNRISHRGLDDSNLFIEGPIALGHQMLHNTLESIHEKLPYNDEITGLTITSDARIDNREELSEILNLHNKENIPDNLFILKAYQKWGHKCPEKLLGDFAFAIWDKNKEELFCARDHMGIKPFYYSITDDTFLFATEKKAILSNSRISNELNEMEIGFFLKNFLDKKSTFYKNISILPPAHYLIIKSQKSFKGKYWELDPDFEINLDSDEEYYKMFLEIFAEAVNCRLRTTSSVGFDLSGGLDSSSIVCMAKKILKEKYHDLSDINTFSYAFNELKDCDERMYIQKVVDSGRIKPHFAINDNISPFNLLDVALKCEDQPFKNPFMSMRMNLYKKVNENGLNILLSGAGGDIIVSHGQRYILELALKVKWIKLIKEVKYLSKRKNTNFYYELGANVIYPLFSRIITKLKCSLNRKIACETDIINSDFEKNLNLNAEINKIEYKIKKFKNSKLAKYYHYYLIQMSSNQNFLEEIDSVAAFYGIEPRYPYYDKRLVEFCYSIPTEMKYRLGWDRFILRNSMEDIIPPEIQWRPSKANFRPFLRKNLISFEENKLNSLFLDGDLIYKYVDLNIIKNIYSKYKNNFEIHFMDIYKLWLVAVLLTWLKKDISIETVQVDKMDQKKIYNKPKLKEHGSLKRLTKLGGTSPADDDGGS